MVKVERAAELFVQPVHGRALTSTLRARQVGKTVLIVSGFWLRLRALAGGLPELSGPAREISNDATRNANSAPFRCART